MPSKFHKNAILTGYIDFYCLVCESYIRSEEDADIHIEKPIHKKNLGFAAYFEKFKDDHIWKVKKGYFCEFCNKFLSTAAKVGLHVAESKHNDNKGTQLLKRVGNSVIISNNVFINEKAWNGIIGETCVLCNTEFYNENIHKTDQGHILNLILKNVAFITESDIYRKVDESSFQCLTCNLIFSLSILNTHFKDVNHIKSYETCSQFTPLTPLGTNTEEKATTLAKKVSSELDSNAKPKVANKIKCTDEAKFVKDTVSSAKPRVDSKMKCNDEATSLKNEEVTVTPDINKNFKANSVENDKASKIKNSATGNSNKANNKPKCDKETHSCDHDESNYETEFNPLLKDSVISAVVKEMKKMWKNEDKPDEKKSKAKSNSREQEKAKILDSITEFQKKGVNVNFENDSVFCKKCFENVDFSFEAIEKHIDEHKSKPTEKVNSEFTIGVNKNHSKTDIKNNNLDKNHNIANQTTKNDEHENENSLDKALVSYTPPANISKTDDQTNGTKASTPGTSKTQTPKVTEESKDPVSYAKANQMTYNKGNSNAYCRICNSRVPANLKNMKEHVNGIVHRNKAAKVATEKKIIPKKPMKKFVTNRSTVANRYNDDVVVNDKYCITRMSYLMITEHGQRLRCQACEINLTEDEVDRHLESSWHERAMDMTPVVWNLPNEFVREVRPGLYHCGFCNLIVGQWEDVASHLSCTDHLGNREFAAVRLAGHLPGILEYRRFKARQLLNMEMGFGLNMGGFYF